MAESKATLAARASRNNPDHRQLLRAVQCHDPGSIDTAKTQPRRKSTNLLPTPSPAMSSRKFPSPKTKAVAAAIGISKAPLLTGITLHR